jgi:hypothetical protein
MEEQNQEFLYQLLQGFTDAIGGRMEVYGWGVFLSMLMQVIVPVVILIGALVWWFRPSVSVKFKPRKL